MIAAMPPPLAAASAGTTLTPARSTVIRLPFSSKMTAQWEQRMSFNRRTELARLRQDRFTYVPRCQLSSCHCGRSRLEALCPVNHLPGPQHLPRWLPLGMCEECESRGSDCCMKSDCLGPRRDRVSEGEILSVPKTATAELYSTLPAVSIHNLRFDTTKQQLHTRPHRYKSSPHHEQKVLAQRTGSIFSDAFGAWVGLAGTKASRPRLTARLRRSRSAVVSKGAGSIKVDSDTSDVLGVSTVLESTKLCGSALHCSLESKSVRKIGSRCPLPTCRFSHAAPRQGRSFLEK